MCSRWTRFYLQDIGKVKGCSMFPFKTRNVMKKMLANIVTHGVPFGKEQGIWTVHDGESKSMLAFWQNVPCLGQELLATSLEALHWFEPSEWAKVAHEGWFICFGYHTQLGQASHNHDRYQQVRFHYWFSFLFPHMSISLIGE